MAVDFTSCARDSHTAVDVDAVDVYVNCCDVGARKHQDDRHTQGVRMPVCHQAVRAMCLELTPSALRQQTNVSPSNVQALLLV